MTDETKDAELFPAEFRHEQVNRFVRGLIEGSIKIKSFPMYDQATKNTVTQLVGDLINDVSSYVSGKLRGQELDAMEQKLFRWLAIMKILDGLEEGITESRMEREIKAVQLRIDSTNTLLLEVMTLLKEVIKYFDEK